jgi:uncharacterized protein
MFSQKRPKWLIATLLVAISLPVGSAYAADVRLGQTTPSPAAEPAPAAPVQEPIPQAKRLLIDELLELNGGRQIHEQMQQSLLVQMQQQMQPLITQMVEDTEDLSPAETEAAIAQISSTVAALLARFSAAIQEEVTYEDVLENVYYPAYAQHFTEEDLRGLIAFYQTPLGEKLVAVTPDLLQTTMQLSSELYLPRMFKVLGEIMQEQMN